MLLSVYIHGGMLAMSVNIGELRIWRVQGFGELLFCRVSTLESWYFGVLVFWRVGILESWYFGVLAFWRVSILES